MAAVKPVGACSAAALNSEWSLCVAGRFIQRSREIHVEGNTSGAFGRLLCPDFKFVNNSKNSNEKIKYFKVSFKLFTLKKTIIFLRTLVMADYYLFTFNCFFGLTSYLIRATVSQFKYQ